MLAKTLEKWGFSALIVNDGQEAVDAWRASPAEFDLVVTDFNMPRLSGPEAARAIIAAAATEDRWCCPIIALCGAVTPEVRPRGCPHSLPREQRLPRATILR